MKHLKSLWFIGAIIISSTQIQAQSPYEFNWKKETGYLAVGGISSGLGIYLRSQTTVLTISEIERLNGTSINSFDRIATDKYSASARNASDVFWAGSHVLPLLFLANKKSRKDFSTIAALYGETFLINGGITSLTKYTIRRSRPFVYNDIVPIEKKLEKNARTAFFSGHTSFTAANTFFIAKVFSDYYPDSNWKPLIWGLAATIPAATGYFRVAGGKHFPTDVITGYVVGAAVGFLVPHWHRKKAKDNGLTFYGGINGAMLQYDF